MPATPCSPTRTAIPTWTGSSTGATNGTIPWPGSRSPAAPTGCRPIDGPFGDFGDADGYTVAARRASILGFEGKWCIHPSQIELANEVFSPNQRLVSRTRRIMAAMEEAAHAGKGAVSLDGRLIDAASLRMAEHLLTKIELIEERENGSPAGGRCG